MEHEDRLNKYSKYRKLLQFAFDSTDEKEAALCAWSAKIMRDTLCCGLDGTWEEIERDLLNQLKEKNNV